MTDRLDRRGFLRIGAAAVIGGAWLTGCDAETPAARRVLLAYFSRADENYHYGGRRNLEIGNTEVLAGTIRDSTACDVHRIEAAEPYSDDYDDTVARNVREQDADACPGATIGDGLAVRGEEVNQAGTAVSSWLQRVGL